ncbi:MAG TPA: hypothetical protein VN580_12430, partial [Clostridia bacterium]|nr:hypothetical protein [Clostridia bacterium]
YLGVVMLRMSRYEKKSRRNTFRRRVLVLFLFVVPLFAAAASFFFMSIYDENGGVDAQADAEQASSYVFKYSYEIESRSFYRLELKSTASLAEAEEFMEDIKAKKLNGFILKEAGYKVIYGVFTDMDQAILLQNIIRKKAEGSISETRLPGYTLRYNDRDNAFIQLVQATDKLIWEVAEAKSGLSAKISENAKADNTTLVTEIESGEAKLERYLGYAEEVTVSKQQEALRVKFVAMLGEVLENRLNDSKNYYKVQGGLMNQIEAYRRYSEGLSDR